MVALYCMTAEGRFGYASKNNEQWEWVEVTDVNQQDGLRTLFTDLQKGVRTGAHFAKRFCEQLTETMEPNHVHLFWGCLVGT